MDTENNYSAMTVNERLVVSGLLTQFDKAVQNNDIEEVKTTLRKVEVSEDSIIGILKQLCLISGNE
jgi:hypothetical protein